MLDGIHNARGHTLVELLAVSGIVAILAGAAVPAFANLLLDSRRNAAVNTALHAANFARQQAAIRGEWIRLCGTQNGIDCSGNGDWSAGLLVADDNTALRRNLPLRGPRAGPRIRSNRATVRFEGGSAFASPATLTICDRRGAVAARTVIISASGRARVSQRDAADRAIAC
jgi:type IV fimbrial biogenesis protein FimT